MRKILILGLLILIIACSFFVAGYYVMFDYDFIDSYTSAVCSGNICQDYSFTCNGGEIVESVPVSGYVTFSSNWVDLRENKHGC